MLVVAVYDTKPHDRQYLEEAYGSQNINWHFFDFRLTEDSAITAKGAEVVCIFVNDTVNRSCFEILAQVGLKLIALRCAGYNNLDLTAAKDLNLRVTRVPAYSPHAVAEHTIGLLLALNRKIFRAYNRVRDLNFSLKGLIGFDVCGKTAGVIGPRSLHQKHVVKIIAVLYDDLVKGYPKNYARDSIPKINHYLDGQTVLMPKKLDRVLILCVFFEHKNTQNQHPTPWISGIVMLKHLIDQAA